MSDAILQSRPVVLGSLPPTGVARDFAATAEERTALAKAYGLLEVRSLSASLAAVPERRGIVSVTGRVQASIVQACIVTLDPVEQEIDETVEARYAPDDAKGVREEVKPGAEIAIDPDAPDPPEIVAGGILDLATVAVEHFLLGIDPYPRAPGAALPVEAEEKAESDSPFAALAKLRAKTGEGG